MMIKKETKKEVAKMTEIKVGAHTVAIEAKEWKKGNHHRIYFNKVDAKEQKYSGKKIGQACWDAIEKEWIPVKYQFGKAFLAQLEKEFELI